jgi:hypothetical protein
MAVAIPVGAGGFEPFARGGDRIEFVRSPDRNHWFNGFARSANQLVWFGHELFHRLGQSQS